MSLIDSLRGICLEEITLYLLAVSGYTTVSSPGTDPTLELNPKGLLCVIGRGESHQIDAVADFFLTQPFSMPNRLLVEAKFHQKCNSPTGIDVIRNAVGVLKDVSEYWVVPKNGKTSPATHSGARRAAIPKSRYHYQYAVISSTGFSANAERYAFAQDIALIQVGRSRYFMPLLTNIGQLGQETIERNAALPDEHAFRMAMRECLSTGEWSAGSTIPLQSEIGTDIRNICGEARAINIGLLATSPSGFPLLLVANPRLNEVLHDLLTPSNNSSTLNSASIRRDVDSRGWIINVRGLDMFSFDIPPRFFSLVHDDLLSGDSDDGHLPFQVVVADVTGRLHGSARGTFNTLTLQLSKNDIRAFLREQNNF